MSLRLHTIRAVRYYPGDRAVVILLSSAALSSCGVLLGDNVKGSFVCSAPGGTCAPSTLIDDQALALIEGARPEAPGSHRPVGLSHAKARAGTFSPTRSGSGSGRSAGIARVSNNLLHRDARTLRLVFPAFVDDAGNLHEARVVHTVVDQAGWIELTDGSLAPRAGTDPGEGETSPDSPAPYSSETSLSDPSFAVPSSDKPMAPASPQSLPPNGPLTIDAIRAQVAQRLAASPKLAQPKVQSPATASHQGALPSSAAENTSEIAAPRSATPGMPAAADPSAVFSGPAQE